LYNRQKITFLSIIELFESIVIEVYPYWIENVLNNVWTWQYTFYGQKTKITNSNLHLKFVFRLCLRL